MKMVNRATKYYKHVPIDSIINEHDLILLPYYEGVYRSIGYYDVYQVYEEVSKSIATKQDYDFRIYEEKNTLNEINKNFHLLLLVSITKNLLTTLIDLLTAIIKLR